MQSVFPDLEVLDVGEGNADGDHCPGIVVREIQAFAYFTPADSNQQGPICSTMKESVAMAVAV